jgi:hypothetical protein
MESLLAEIQRMDAELADQIVDGTYTYSELSRAFDAVKNPRDWKAAILAAMPGEAVMVVVAAIKFFTATVPTVALNTRTMLYQVRSEGYRAGPAGDH